MSDLVCWVKLAGAVDESMPNILGIPFFETTYTIFDQTRGVGDRRLGFHRKSPDSKSVETSSLLTIAEGSSDLNNLEDSARRLGLE